MNHGLFDQIYSNPWFPKVILTEPQGSVREAQGSANEKYKQEAFYPARGAFFTMAIQMYCAVLSVRTELLRFNKIDLEKHKLRERERR